MKKLFLLLAVAFFATLNSQVSFSLYNNGILNKFIPTDLVENTTSTLVMTGNYFPASTIIPQCYRTTNYGTTWDSLYLSGSIGGYNVTLGRSNYVGANYYMGIYNTLGANGVLRSANGYNWSQADNSLPYDYRAQNFIYLNSNYYVLGYSQSTANQSPVMYELLSSNSWNLSATMGFPASATVIAAASKPSTAFVSTINSSSVCEVYKSTDAVNWTACSNGIPSNFNINDLVAYSELEILAIGNIISGGVSLARIYKTLDGGANWALLAISGVQNHSHHYQAGAAHGGYLFLAAADAAGNYAIYRTNQVVGLTEMDRANEEVLIWPNPAKDQIFLEIAQEEPADIKLLSLEGKILYEEKTTCKSRSVNIKDLDKGIYFISLQTKNSVTVKKIVKD